MEQTVKQLSVLVLLPENFDVDKYNSVITIKNRNEEEMNIINSLSRLRILETTWTDSTEIAILMRKLFCNGETPELNKLIETDYNKVVDIYELCDKIKKLSRLPPSLIHKVESLIQVEDKKYNTYLYSEFNYTEKTLRDLINAKCDNVKANIYYYETEIVEYM